MRPYREIGVRGPGDHCRHCGCEMQYISGISSCGPCGDLEVREREEQLKEFMQKAMWVRS